MWPDDSMHDSRQSALESLSDLDARGCDRWTKKKITKNKIDHNKVFFVEVEMRVCNIEFLIEFDRSGSMN